MRYSKVLSIGVCLASIFIESPNTLSDDYSVPANSLFSQAQASNQNQTSEQSYVPGVILLKLKPETKISSNTVPDWLKQ